MSNTKKPKDKPNSLERYRSEVKGGPFVLWISDEEKLEIPRPTGEALFDAEDAARFGNSREAVRALAGDKADELLEILGVEDAAVMQAVATDMQEHFGLGN